MAAPKSKQKGNEGTGAPAAPAAHSSHSHAPLPPSFVHFRNGMDFLLTNRFTEFDQFQNRINPPSQSSSFIDTGVNTSLQLASLNCWVRVTDAVTSNEVDQLQKTLDYVWSVEARSRSATVRSSKGNSSSAGYHPITIQLVQGDTHFVGAVLQIMLESFIRGFYNLNRAFSFYSSALKAIEHAEQALSSHTPSTTNSESSHQYDCDKAELVELRAWAELGCGFQVLLSMLPPTIAKIGNWIGFASDRLTGLRQLESSALAGAVMSSVSAFLLANFSISSVTYLGEPDEKYIPTVRRVLAFAKDHWPEAWFFSFVQSRLSRHDRQLDRGVIEMKESVRAVSLGGRPEFAILLNIQLGWCAFFQHDWEAAASYFNSMLHHSHSPYGWYDAKVDYVQDRRPWSASRIAEIDTKGTTIPPSRINSQAFLSLLTGLCHLHMSFSQHDAHKGAERSESVVRSIESAPHPSPSPGVENMLSHSPSPDIVHESINLAQPPSPSSRIQSPSPSSLASAPTASSHLNLAFWYIQNALTLLDHTRSKMKPLDLYAKRHCESLLERRFEEFPSKLWLDTCDLLLKWNGAQQMNESQIQFFLHHIRPLCSHPPSFFGADDTATALMLQSYLLRSLHGCVKDEVLLGQARSSLQQFMSFIPRLQKLARTQIDGILAFGFYESAILYYEMAEYDQAKVDLKKAQAISDYDQYNVMQVRCHALNRLIKDHKP